MKKKLKNRPKCIDCGKLLSRLDAKKCQKCYVKTMKGKNHPMSGKTHTEKSRKKMSKTRNERKIGKGKNHYIYKVEIDLWMNDNQNKHKCKCGCEKYIKVKRYHYCRRIPEYLPHHCPPVNLFKKGQTASFKGKHHTKEWKKEKSLSMGGTGIPYENTEYGAEFDSALKEQVRFRDGYKCKICGCSQLENGRQLDCHHIDYNKENNKMNNLVALCMSCHRKTNYNRNYWKQLLGRKNAKEKRRA